ncbi:MAG: hypothetical protein AAGC54_01825, partial [Cyanobacteria bacterium P01_F01_bin.4]
LKPFIELEQGDFPLAEEQVPDIVDLLEESAQENALENEPKATSESILDSEDLPVEQDSPVEQENNVEAPAPPSPAPPSPAPQVKEQPESDLDDVWQRLRQYRQRSIEGR